MRDFRTAVPESERNYDAAGERLITGETAGLSREFAMWCSAISEICGLGIKIRQAEKEMIAAPTRGNKSSRC